MEVRGFPRRWETGARYPLQVHLRSPGMARAGFQLSVRFEDGRQAGRLEGTGPGVEIAGPDSAGVLYAGHERPAAVGPDGRAFWWLAWTAPEDPEAAVRLHVAANGANGDDSEFGDAVYADSFTSGPGTAGGEPCKREKQGEKEGR